MRFYDTKAGEKQEFVPIDPNRVRLYVCGPTVYDYAHIGNARPVIVFDVLFRVLRQYYGEDHVIYARNITDVDDKIINRTKEQFKAEYDAIIKIGGYPKAMRFKMQELIDQTTDQFNADVRNLGCLDPTFQPRATKHIKEMIGVIELLIIKGHAYVSNGHVLFKVNSKPSGLSFVENRSMDNTIGRIGTADYKQNQEDFVLWKPESVYNAVACWSSPWGFGRPGWHIECSAMSHAYLGETFDIHGGGIDLIFPHHENEVAQSCCAFGTEKLANVWMHNHFVTIEGEKMSKSSGNFLTINGLLEDWDGQVLRFNMLRTHYRQPLDWTRKRLKESEQILLGWQDQVSGVTPGQPDPEFMSALHDDLNTPMAFKRLHELSAAGDVETLAASARFLGLLERPIVRKLKFDTATILSLVAQRKVAKEAKDYAEADRIRNHLHEMGIEVKDGIDPVSGTPTYDWNPL